MARFIIAGALGLGAAPLALAACGAAGSGHHEHASTPQYHITYIGQAQRIVSVNPPGGPAFSIFGQRYRFGGQNDVELQRRFAEPWRVDVQSTGGWGGQSSSLTDDQGIEVIQGCQVHPFAVIYGPLDNSGDSLFVRTPDGTVRLPRVAIPQSLHMPGAFFYGVATSVPSGFVVRARGGTVVQLMETSGSQEGPPCAGARNRNGCGLTWEGPRLRRPWRGSSSVCGAMDSKLAPNPKTGSSQALRGGVGM
ncbi:MAG: hypothetical protein WAU69_06755 [Solirubrobacteraceae bacterium]